LTVEGDRLRIEFNQRDATVAQKQALESLLETQKKQLEGQQNVLAKLGTAGGASPLLQSPQDPLDTVLGQEKLKRESEDAARALDKIFSDPTLSAHQLIEQLEAVRSKLADVQREANKPLIIKQLATDLTSGVGSALDNILLRTTSLRDGVISLLKDVEKAFLHAFLAQPLQDLQGGLQGLFGAKGLNVLGSLASAQGNAFDRGNVVAFATGGVPDLADTPTYFPLSGGRSGVFGEAGPEAILPLKRDSSGSLGISASGSGSQRTEVHHHTTHVHHWNISTPDAGSFRRSKRQLEDQAQRALKRGQR